MHWPGMAAACVVGMLLDAGVDLAASLVAVPSGCGAQPARRTSGNAKRAFIGPVTCKRGAYTSSHSLRTAALLRMSCGVPSKTIAPWPIT